MHEITCSHCGGSGKERAPDMVEGIDWSFDFSQGFSSYCCQQEEKDAMRDKCIAFLRTLKRGDKFMRYGSFESTALRVGMYDGWPYWKPTPAVAYIGPLGSVEYAFYYNVSAPYRSGSSSPTSHGEPR